MAKRVDMYSILTRNGYKMPRYSDTIGVKGDIYKFLNENVGFDSDLTTCFITYSDNQWYKIIGRLRKHGHTREEV
ncbi:hypothetical protein PQE70_gp036 [Bacillus phage vB_BanS_Nate]|uniref:Uncharacterized protein n=1 Tax=Bacillus phage vB_BanS_Nate TaxID=2894788 RepID=A0AAE9CE53_9CAUD|nr:hypothetical protein PQE70_gp036 [Bacillus phage vB_BanS_Nate]UGO50889.1 hypothetical protein NATE_36 [Bacillus phage vB_BanS_Nate]